MNKHTFYIAFMITATVFTSSLAARSGDTGTDLSDRINDSIVYLETSSYGYNIMEPWNRSTLSERWACACAVGPYEVITTAQSMANLTFLRVLRYGQNEFIGAKIKVVDYQTNLCLIELDPNELIEPLIPMEFVEDYQKGAAVDCYWLTADNSILNARGFLDRVSIQRVRTSFGQNLRYNITGASQSTSAAEVYFANSKAIGIACRSDRDEVSLIPGEIINRFLNALSDDNYEGFGNIGFTISELLNPSMRDYLKMPESIKGGVYVSNVYNLGTGSDTLRSGDVILTIDGNEIDPYGRFEHPEYERLLFDHLITTRNVGDSITFELWRDAEKIQIQSTVKKFEASDMLVPYHEFDQQPEYIVLSGFVLQKLTREYLSEFGSDLAGDAPSHLYHYYRDLAFKPTPERMDIVILSYVLPTQYNLGFAGLGQMVVEKINGMTITSIDDIPQALELNPESKYHVLEFELDNPVVVIGREQIPAADLFVRENYGVTKLSNINR